MDRTNGVSHEAGLFWVLDIEPSPHEHTADPYLPHASPVVEGGDGTREAAQRVRDVAGLS